MNRREILETAISKIDGDRNRDYGDPKVNHDRIALLWNAYIEGMPPCRDGLKAVDVILMMELLKVARLMESPDHEDSWVDMAGYAGIGLECAG